MPLSRFFHITHLSFNAIRENFRIYSTFLNELSFEGHCWRVDDDGTFDCEYTGGEIVPHELIDILCDVSNVCEEANDDNKFAIEAGIIIDIYMRIFRWGLVLNIHI